MDVVGSVLALCFSSLTKCQNYGENCYMKSDDGMTMQVGYPDYVCCPIQYLILEKYLYYLC